MLRLYRNVKERVLLLNCLCCPLTTGWFCVYMVVMPVKPVTELCLELDDSSAWMMEIKRKTPKSPVNWRVNRKCRYVSAPVLGCSSWEAPDWTESAFVAKAVVARMNKQEKKGVRAKRGRECVAHLQDSPLRRSIPNGASKSSMLNTSERTLGIKARFFLMLCWILDRYFLLCSKKFYNLMSS